MDQRPLVENQIDDSFKLARFLTTEGCDVTAAFWVRTSDEEDWTLYLASRVVDESGPLVVYRKVVDALQRLVDPWVTISEITVIGERNPITQDVLRIMQKHPGPMATR